VRFGRTVFLVGLGGALLLGVWVITRSVCLGAWLEHGVVVDRCPDGELRLGLTLEVNGWQRGKEGTVNVVADALYTLGPADEVRRTRLVDGHVASLALVVNGKERALTPTEEGWKRTRDDRLVASVVLPADVPDGEHLLRAKVDTPLGEDTVEAKLPVFAPARLHTFTDRPLYEPGNTMRFRSVVLRARDLAPLAERPGVWQVRDPSGEVVLEEKARADAWGVVAGDLPLDEGCPTGDWRVRWTSNGAYDEVSVRVEPFTLPRFTVEATADRTFYKAGQVPKLLGRVVYASGAPVDADVEIQWRQDGAWPPPPQWQRKSLPKRAKTDDDGRFEIELPEVPADVRGQFRLTALFSAVDAAGDRVTGAGGVLLVEHEIAVEAVTELRGGLVEGVNNRMYVRATTADGAVLPGATLRIKRAWDEADKGIEAKTDEDGVAVVQIDPGPAVNVVVPPMPVRPVPRPEAVQRVRARELIARREPTLKETTILDAWNDALAPCARFVDGSRTVAVSMRVASNGQMIGVSHGRDPIELCVGETVREQRLGLGDERIFEAAWAFRSDMATLNHDTGGTADLPEKIEDVLERALLDARECVRDDATEGALPRMWLWNLQRRRFTARAVRDEKVDRPINADVARCIEARLFVFDEPRTLSKEDAPERDVYGWTRVRVRPAPRVQQRKPRPTTMLGYELRIEAESDGEQLGHTLLRLRPGEVPPLRLRAEPVLPVAGADVVVKAIRGPKFSGALPEKVYLTHHAHERIESKLDDKTREARFKIPEGVDGWFEVSIAGTTARVFVRPSARLEVAVEPDQAAYAPRADAKLGVTTTAGGKPTQASVTLAGVDQTLGQLTALPGADDMQRMLPNVSMQRQAFGALDATALVQGRVRGANAAAAIVSLVSSVPAASALDATTAGSAQTRFDPIETLTDRFYVVLGEVHDLARAWEWSAPKDEKMTAARMAKMWDDALASLTARGEDVKDAYGRPLRLRVLPGDLLVLVDPRAVIVEGTRLPEDVEDWTDWVVENTR
jgi:hypothetical protein